MRGAPKQPRESSGKTNRTELGDGRFAADRDQAACAPVTEPAERQLARDPRRDHAADKGTLLLRDRRHARLRLTVLLEMRRIADDEGVWITRE